MSNETNYFNLHVTGLGYLEQRQRSSNPQRQYAVLLN